jgi:hypothetical protein
MLASKTENQRQIMKWIEIIELRSTDKNRESLESQLQKLTSEVNKARERGAIKVYSRLAIDTDFSIHLFHESKEADIDASSLGLHLASSLKGFGLVNHSVWIEMYDR